MVVIVCTLESDHGLGSESAPSQRVSTCAPACTASESAGTPAEISSRRHGVVDGQLLCAVRAVRVASTPGCHRRCRRRSPRSPSRWEPLPPRCRCTTARSPDPCPSRQTRRPRRHRPGPARQLRAPFGMRRARPPSPPHPPSTRRLRRYANRRWWRRRHIRQPRSHAVGRRRRRVSIPAAAASSLRACSRPRSVIRATPRRSASSRSGSARRWPHAVQYPSAYAGLPQSEHRRRVPGAPARGMATRSIPDNTAPQRSQNRSVSDTTTAHCGHSTWPAGHNRVLGRIAFAFSTNAIRSQTSVVWCARSR